MTFIKAVSAFDLRLGIAIWARENRYVRPVGFASPLALVPRYADPYSCLPEHACRLYRFALQTPLTAPRLGRLRRPAAFSILKLNGIRNFCDVLCIALTWTSSVDMETILKYWSATLPTNTQPSLSATRSEQLSEPLLSLMLDRRCRIVRTFLDVYRFDIARQRLFELLGTGPIEQYCSGFNDLLMHEFHHFVLII
jgi:hypothetical protein